MENFGTSVAVKLVSKALKIFYARSFFDDITNRDFFTVGNTDPKTTQDIKDKGQKFRIPTLFSNGWQDYDGTDIDVSEVKESMSDLTIDQTKALGDLIKDISQFKSQVDNPKSTLIQQVGDSLKKLMDSYVLKSWADAAAGNHVGTVYDTGTVAIDVDGNVTGTDTVFIAAMVGKSFKAAGHSKWYRVKSRSGNTAIVIENDSDDEASAYDGGVIAGGAAYEIQANAKVAVDSTNIASYLIKLKTKLTNAGIPDDGNRFCLLPADAEESLLTASQFNPSIKEVNDETVQKGRVKKAYGFNIYIAPNDYFEGDNTSGYHCLAGHTAGITAGYGFISPIKSIEPEKNFGEILKGLFAFGTKVADERRKALAHLYATFDIAA